MAISQTITNSYNLLISSNGGNGSKGQNGDDSKNGRTPPTDPEIYKNNHVCDSDLCDKNKKILGFDCVKKKCVPLLYCDYKLIGEKRKPAAGGAKGGLAGQKGRHNHFLSIKRYELSIKSKILSFQVKLR